MAESLFHTLEYEAFRAGITPRSKEAREWFKTKIKQMGSINNRTLLKDPAVVKKRRPAIGQMYMFFYDPKHRQTLPYYDAFPLTIMVGPAKGGFYGLNLHYLHPTLRAKLMDGLLDTVNNKRYDETTKFKINYQMLNSIKNLKYYKPCFKHYLSAHIESTVTMVESPEWEIAMYLPSEQFRKMNARKVWAESRRSI